MFSFTIVMATGYPASQPLRRYACAESSLSNTMQSYCRYIGTLFFLLVASSDAFSTEISTRVIDGLGRPVANATVSIRWYKSTPGKGEEQVVRIKMVSDTNGIAKATFDGEPISEGDVVRVNVSKVGYRGGEIGLLPEYVLNRVVGPADVECVAANHGETQINELRELLAGDFLGSESGLDKLVFAREHEFRPALRALITDVKVGSVASYLLSFICFPEDVQLIVNHAAAPKKEEYSDNRWAYYVVSALLEPATEREWNFLWSCARNEYEDRWVDAGAIRTLMLIASPRSHQILKEVIESNKDRADYIKQALQYIESVPPSLSDEDVIAAGKKVAEAIRIGKWEGNRQPLFNAKGDMALIDCAFMAGEDEVIHTATFHRQSGKWKLRGVRETNQAFIISGTYRVH